MAETMTPIQVIIVWLGYLNIGLGIVNLTPALPMDGGHILRAIMWWITGDRLQASKRILFTGTFFASCYLVIGILLIIKGIVFGGLLLLIIGWYLDVTTQVKVSQRDIWERLRGVCVRDLMARKYPFIDGNTNLQTFVENHLSSGGEGCFLISQRGKLMGLITFHEVRNIGHRRWPYTVIYDVMNRIDQLQTVNPEAPITEALELMGGSQTNQLAVMSNGQLVGIISRDHIMGHLLAGSEF
jgi:CBS domain-containing protein